MTRPLGLVVALALASGCAAAGGTPSTSETPRRDLAVRPSPLPAGSGVPGSASASPGAGHSATPGPGTSAGGPAPAATGPGSTPSGGAGAASTAPFSTFLTMPDGAGDAGLGAPAYADLR